MAVSLLVLLVLAVVLARDPPAPPEPLRLSEARAPPAVILAIGPFARLDRRFLPPLYNRRHARVAVFVLAIAHANFVLDCYFAFSRTPPVEALLSSDTAFMQLEGFPFEAPGIAALLILAIVALTSHELWLTFLGPRFWKSLHFLDYAACVLTTADLVLGARSS